MKSIKLLVLSLCGLFSMSSCVNDFLDRDPMDIISEDLVWSLYGRNVRRYVRRTSCMVD